MRLATRLTLDGLVRALRAQAHRLGDEIEEGRARRQGRFGAEIRRDRQIERRTGANDDDVSGD